MGVPLFVHDMPLGVVSPVVSRIKGEVRERFRELTLFVATESELSALRRACVPEQRIVLFKVEIPAAPRPPAVTYRRAGRVRSTCPGSDRKRVVPGKSVSFTVYIGGRRI